MAVHHGDGSPDGAHVGSGSGTLAPAPDRAPTEPVPQQGAGDAEEDPKPSLLGKLDKVSQFGSTWLTIIVSPLRGAVWVIDWINAKVDRAWLWGAVGVLAAWIGSFGQEVDGRWVKTAFYGPALVLGLLAIVGVARRDRSLRAKDKEIDELLKEVNALAGEVDDYAGEVTFSREARIVLSEALDTFVAKVIQRHYIKAGLNETDRVTWTLVGDDLRVVGRHCNDPSLTAVNTQRYDKDHGLLGHAVKRRRLVEEFFDPTADGGVTWAKWQTRSGRLASKEAANTLSMQSTRYAVVPFSAHDGLSVLGLIVIESTDPDTAASGARVKNLIDLLIDDLMDKTVKDIFTVLAAVPDFPEED